MLNNTETPNPLHTNLDLYPVDRLIDTFVKDQINAVKAVWASRTQLADAVRAAAPRITAGGRLIYVGAGTSGRLGLLDSVELYPTFSWPRERAIALLAGGATAITEAIEGAEDDDEQGAADLLATRPSPDDVVLAIAASGRTPYVLGALRAARRVGALTIGFANNPQSAIVVEAEIGVTLDTGPEIISGSTRLKAGTAQKIALNSFSSALMVSLHKVYSNLMVDLRPTNAKLVRRSLALTVRVTGASSDLARQTLESCGFQVKVAIVALKRGISVEDAESHLTAVGGSVRRAIED